MGRAQWRRWSSTIPGKCSPSKVKRITQVQLLLNRDEGTSSQVDASQLTSYSYQHKSVQLKEIFVHLKTSLNVFKNKPQTSLLHHFRSNYFCHCDRQHALSPMAITSLWQKADEPEFCLPSTANCSLPRKPHNLTVVFVFLFSLCLGKIGCLMSP